MAEALDITLGIIGGGSMGGSIARGVVEARTLPADRVMVADFDAAKLEALSALGMRTFSGSDALLDAAPDVLLLAVKPQVLPDVMGEIADFAAGRLVISIAAGVALATIEGALPGARVVRAMPNLPVQVRSGATALAAGSAATADDLELALRLFSSLGAAAAMREDQLDVSGAVVGTAPAFFALFVDTLTRAGVKAGLPVDVCRGFLETTMRGCAEQLLDEGVHPRAYLDRVTSPGGTTACALFELEGPLFEASHAAVDAAMARTRELAGR